MRKPLSRRTLLRGAGGIAIALPFLDAMSAFAQTAPKKRLVLLSSPNGSIAKNWKPTGSETSFTLGPILAPLAAHKGDLLILDGLPRNVAQARLMHKYINVLRIVHLKCEDKEEMIKRLSRRALKENRPDDAREDVIRRRWEVYERETFPVLEFYPKHLVTEVNAVGAPANVLCKVLEAVAPVQDSHFRNPLDGAAR